MGFFDFLKDAGDKESARQGMSDEELSELTTENTIIRKIKTSGLSMDGIHVDFDDGVARLSGSAQDQRTRELAVLIAGNTPGVARVDDRLGVAEGTGTPDFGGNLYTVEKGDTLSEIARERLGDASRWPEIFEANKPMLSDPDRIYPGQVLRMPGR